MFSVVSSSPLSSRRGRRGWGEERCLACRRAGVSAAEFPSPRPSSPFVPHGEGVRFALNTYVIRATVEFQVVPLWPAPAHDKLVIQRFGNLRHDAKAVLRDQRKTRSVKCFSLEKDGEQGAGGGLSGTQGPRAFAFLAGINHAKWNTSRK